MISLCLDIRRAQHEPHPHLHHLTIHTSHCCMEILNGENPENFNPAKLRSNKFSLLFLWLSTLSTLGEE